MKSTFPTRLAVAGCAVLLTAACTTNPQTGGEAASSTPAVSASSAATSAASSAPPSGTSASSVSGTEATSVAPGTVSEVTGSVAFLLPNTTTTRFIQHDSPAFVAAMGELAPGVTVDVLNAEGKSDQQLSQAESAINSGAKALVLVAADPSLSGAVLQKAAEANIPVIGYEHEALDGPLYAQVIFDPKKVGEAQGQYFADNLPAGKDGMVTISRVYGNNGDNYTIQDQAGQNEKIQPLIDSGKVAVACEDYAAGWDPAAAQQLVEQCLTRTQNQIDAVLAMNDGTASGAIAALQGQGLAGQIPVYGGQDANLDALKFILQGQQTDTVFKDYALEGATAAQVVVAALEGREPPSSVINATFDNKAVQAPAAYLDVQSIDAANMQVVIDAGLYTKDEICDGIGDVAFCG
ncbi:sugar ABC transporter substrate-binding protein [Nakamurella deserti]|uniref:sugar ABC transporter substrate-binding protein n=1 Tax=Nakamurella deserti TaxID=2164074 RepID=UPI000DBE7771|nr:substrate-binding domain-containing protein [Nakamurella deserti]